MFFVTYLQRELRRRVRQAVLVALGLALGVGLVVTVAAASAGVSKAEVGVLSGLYGVGTDITVTGPSALAAMARACTPTPTVPCFDGRPYRGKGTPVPKPSKSNGQILFPPLFNQVSASAVAAVARLHDVAAAAGVLTLVGQSHQSGTYTVDGADTGHTSVGPLSTATISSGHFFTAADSDADVALVDSSYATSNNLKVGSAITIKQVRFTVIGIVSPQPGTSPPDVYIPLARAQAVGTGDKDGAGSLANDVNLIYVAAASAADIPAVQGELSRLLPGDTVTAASSLASEVTGSLSDAAKLTGDLGRWVSALALIAAFAVACLLTLAGVSRRSAEFGALKSLGWRTRRIVAQVLGESLVMGIAGGAAGVGVGFAGAAIIADIAPKVSGTDSSAIGSMQQVIQNGSPAPVVWRAVSVPLSPSVTAGVIVLAVVLAMAGGLLAGALGAWRIARLRPASALTLVA
ncbi:MAG TPA: ABC transporter permease [Streptosporangiaceae bacterium]|nr:ABC transporter permease [Streptosporangiaceae bacterium]